MKITQRSIEQNLVEKRVSSKLKDVITILSDRYFKAQSSDMLREYYRLVTAYKNEDMARYPVMPKKGSKDRSDRRRKVYCISALLTATIIEFHAYMNSSSRSSKRVDAMSRKLANIAAAPGPDAWVLKGDIKQGYWLKARRKS